MVQLILQPHLGFEVHWGQKIWPSRLNIWKITILLFFFIVASPKSLKSITKGSLEVSDPKESPKKISSIFGTGGHKVCIVREELFCQHVHTLWHPVQKMDEIFFGDSLGSKTSKEPFVIDFKLFGEATLKKNGKIVIFLIFSLLGQIFCPQWTPKPKWGCQISCTIYILSYIDLTLVNLRQ